MTLRRAAYCLCAPAVCLALFWRVLFTWFRTDDFGLLNLAARAHDFSSLMFSLFHPIAQGTVRVLSDRMFYLVLYSMFGVRAGPFHIVALLTWFLTLALGAEMGTRITKSRAGGLLAALLWTTSPVMVTPLAWAAVYEVVLCAFFGLAALYARARWLETNASGWRTAEWILFLLGFGAQESMVMYPAVAVLYTWAVARRNPLSKQERGVFALFAPSAAFAAIHLFLIPKAPSQTYRIAVDMRLPHTLSMYLRMSLGPEQFAARKILGPALAAFLAWRLWRRDWAALFCAGWYLFWLAPMLPLPNHISDYYLAGPQAGVAWLGAGALLAAWRSGTIARAAAAALAALYLVNAAPEITRGTSWYQDRTSRMRFVFRAMEELAWQKPDTVVIFSGVDNALFQTGFQDNPFALAGVAQAFLAPGSEKGIVAREDLGGIQGLTISTADALKLIESGKARVLEIRDGPPQEITKRYGRVLRAEFLATHRHFVDAGEPLYAPRLGGTWYEIENGTRWMPKHATVQLGGPSSPDQRLYVAGYAPASALASGPVTLRVSAGRAKLGSCAVRQPDDRFQCDFPLPGNLVGEYAVEIIVDADKSFRAPGDGRELGMVFGTFAIR